MPPKLLLAAAAAAALAACAPGAPPAAAPRPTADTVTRALRPVPVPPEYAAAVAAGTRSATGQPGPRYWQNRVRYDIQAELDPASTVLSGRERIVLHNRSPERLENVVLNLYQNVFAPHVPRNRTIPSFEGGVTLARVAAQGVELADETDRRTEAPGYQVRGTLALLELPRAVASGDSVVLEVAWTHRVPPAGAFRTGWQDALGGRAFQVAQWYPQVATFDDLRGWDATPYLGDGEFYLEYGDFDVALTLPAGWVVGATGTLANEAEVLSPAARERLRAALASDTALRVATPADVAPGRDGRVTWRYQARDVRDFAFAASDRYVWDALGAEVPQVDGAGTRRVAVHALYRPGAPGWERAARYGEHALEEMSRRVMPYVWPQVTIAEGTVGGMEYPMLVFIGKPSRATALQSVIGHEVAHEWFPMMVGSDEAAYAWMDEGITEYHEDAIAADFFPGTDPYAETREGYLRVAGTEREVPLMRHTDLVSPYGARVIAAYTKPAVVLRSLRAVLGDSVFDRALSTYAREWYLKHPSPWDFFATVERVSGRDLDWFFYPWWFETATLDQAVASVGPADGGVRVVVRDLGTVAMPARVSVTGADGAAMTVEIPVTAWTAGPSRTAEVTVPVSGAPARVEIDPGHLFPDVDRANNVWTAP